jgi:hypothetical protein
MAGMSLDYKVSLDNLTIVGVPKYKASIIRSLLVGESFEGFISNFWQTAHGRYFENFTLLGGGFLQITHDKGHIDSNKFTIHQIRLEFNPNKVLINKAIMGIYLDILRLIQEPKITRKDIAVDILGLDLNEFNIIDYSSRKRIEYKTGSMVLETLYFGSRDSDERIRIYNKALEQGLLTNRSKTNKETGEKIQTTIKQDGLLWWRIEAQIRKEKAEMMKINPFKKIRLVYKQDFLHLDVRERAMLFYLQANPDSMKELSKNVRSKYKKMLGEQLEEYYIDIEGIANESLEEIQSQIESWLNFSPMDVKEGFRVTALESCLNLKDEKQTDEERLKMIAKVEEWAEINFEDVPRETMGVKNWEEWLKQRDKEI